MNLLTYRAIFLVKVSLILLFSVGSSADKDTLQKGVITTIVERVVRYYGSIDKDTLKDVLLADRYTTKIRGVAAWTNTVPVAIIWGSKSKDSDTTFLALPVLSNARVGTTLMPDPDSESLDIIVTYTWHDTLKSGQVRKNYREFILIADELREKSTFDIDSVHESLLARSEVVTKSHTRDVNEKAGVAAHKLGRSPKNASSKQTIATTSLEDGAKSATELIVVLIPQVRVFQSG